MRDHCKKSSTSIATEQREKFALDAEKPANWPEWFQVLLQSDSHCQVCAVGGYTQMTKEFATEHHFFGRQCHRLTHTQRCSVIDQLLCASSAATAVFHRADRKTMQCLSCVSRYLDQLSCADVGARHYFHSSNSVKLSSSNKPCFRDSLLCCMDLPMWSRNA